MKLFAVVLAFATLAVSTAHAAECDLKLYDAVSIPELEKCETEAGFDFVALATPTDEVKAKFCKSEACLTIWQAAKTAAPAECAVKGKQLYADVLDPLEAACKKAGVTTTSGGNTTSHGSKNSTSHGPKNSTSHGHSHASGSKDSSDDDSVVKMPSNSTTKPSSAPNSGVSPLSLTAGVAFISLAAASFL